MARSPGRLLIVGSLAIALAMGACGQEESNDPAGQISQEVEVEAYDFYFEETSLTFDIGTLVTIDLVNSGDNTHSFTAPDIDVDVQVESAETTEFSFSAPDEPGVFNFFCKFHPDQMEGTISIGGVDEPLEEEET